MQLVYVEVGVVVRVGRLFVQCGSSVIIIIMIILINYFRGFMVIMDIMGIMVDFIVFDFEKRKNL